MFQHEAEKSAKGLLIHPSPLENFAAHSIKQEDLNLSFHHPEDELKQEPEDLKSPQWLSKIQQLRTDFAFQVLEARRRQGCEQEQLYYPPSLQLISQLSSPRDACSLQPDHIKDNPAGGKGALDLVNTFLQRMEHPGRSPQESLVSPTRTSPSLTAGQTLQPANRLGKRGRPRKHAPKVSLTSKCSFRSHPTLNYLLNITCRCHCLPSTCSSGTCSTRPPTTPPSSPGSTSPLAASRCTSSLLLKKLLTCESFYPTHKRLIVRKREIFKALWKS